MTSSITVEPYETVEFSESDTDSWQVVDPFDSENDDVITTESDVTTSDEEEDEDVDVVVDDVVASESDVISSEDDEEEEDEEDDVISSDEDEEEDDEEDEDDVTTSEDEEEDDEDDVITPMSSDEMINHTQELNKAVVEFDGPYNVKFSDSMKVDAYFERSQLERMLYEDDVEEEEHDEDEDEDDYDEDLDDELIPRWLNNKFERQRMRKLGKKVYPKMKKSKRMVNQYNRPGCAGAKHGLGLKHNLIG